MGSWFHMSNTCYTSLLPLPKYRTWLVWWTEGIAVRGCCEFFRRAPEEKVRTTNRKDHPGKKHKMTPPHRLLMRWGCVVCQIIWLLHTFDTVGCGFNLSFAGLTTDMKALVKRSHSFRKAVYSSAPLMSFFLMIWLYRLIRAGAKLRLVIAQNSGWTRKQSTSPNRSENQDTWQTTLIYILLYYYERMT